MTLFELSQSDLRTKAHQIWSDGNDSGAGYAVGSPDDDISQVEGIGALVYREGVSDGLAIYRDGDDIVLVGDSNGPWAVRCSAVVD